MIRSSIKVGALHLAVFASLSCQGVPPKGNRPVTSGRTSIGATASVGATAKGPNQINLTWPPAPSPGYGYIVEIQSGDDPRYSEFTELQPVATASGYTCDPSVSWHGVAGCNISDAS